MAMRSRLRRACGYLLPPPASSQAALCAGHCQSEGAPSPLRARQAMVLSTMLIAPLLQAAAVAKTHGCIFTSACSVVSPRPGEPEKLRVHTIFYNNGRVGDLPGSWLLAAIHDGVLDCGGNGATRQSDSGRRTLWIGGPFSPLRNVSSPEEAELLFLPLESEFNDVGSDQMLRGDAAVRLDPCGGTSARHVLDALGQIDDKIQFVWDAPPMARRTWLPLSTVMSHVSARARVVLALSEIPDVSTEVLENGLRFVMGQGFGGGHSRVLLMHYRAGTTCAPPRACTTSCMQHQCTTLDYRCPFLLNHCAGLIPTNGHGVARNPRFRGKQLFWNNYWRELSWQAVSQFKAEGRCNSSLPPPDARPTTPSTFLLLGGDAHHSRQYVVKALHREGLLEHALWSLSTPDECQDRWSIEGPKGPEGEELPGRRENKLGWDEFCRLFPKRLDLDLRGEHEASSKDRTFAPQKFYERTRFSVVFESSISGDHDNYTPFLTEKILKPIFAGHPFVIVCGARGLWDVIRTFGFRSFEPTIPIAALPTLGPLQHELQSGKCGVNPEHARAVAKQLRRLVEVPSEAWRDAEAAASFNRHHFGCGGFNERLLSIEREVLVFAHGGQRAADSQRLVSTDVAAANPNPSKLSAWRSAFDAMDAPRFRAAAADTTDHPSAPSSAIEGPAAQRSKQPSLQSQLAKLRQQLELALQQVEELKLQLRQPGGEMEEVDSARVEGGMAAIESSLTGGSGRRSAGGGSGGVAGRGGDIRAALRSAMRLGQRMGLCQGEWSATLLNASALLRRFCERGQQRCVSTQAALRSYLPSVMRPDGGLAIILREGSGGSGFGIALQEKANVLLAGVVTGRPVFIAPERDGERSSELSNEDGGSTRHAFNAGGALLGPALDGSPSLLVPSLPAHARGFWSFEECKAAMQRNARLKLPYACAEAGEGKWEVQLNDDDVPEIIQNALGWWARFEHRVKPSPLRHFFPHATPFTFRSPSVVGAMLPYFLRADPQPPPLNSSPPGGPALALSELAHLSGEFAGPGCLVRYLIGSAAPSVIRALGTTLLPCQQPGKVSCALVGLHVRRGDSAMARECKTCVDQGDPDVRGSDRIETARVAALIGLVNRSLAGWSAAFNRRVFVFMASDTEWAVKKAREIIGESNVLVVKGQPIHSPQVSAKERKRASIKIAADFLGLALSDVVLAIGQSAFSGNAAAMSLAPSRAGDSSLASELGSELLSRDQVEAVKQSLLLAIPGSCRGGGASRCPFT